jgi:EmrB/QacA subfamily drug resistance transporter
VSATEAPPLTQPARPGRPDRTARLALATVMLGAFMCLLDTTIVNVALPGMQHALHASDDALEWVVSGYALAFGIVLIPAGRLGDAIGRKPLYIAGLLAFLAASLGAGLAQGPAELVVARIIQGLAAGVYYTQINATIVDVFAPRDRSKAFGVLAAVIGLSTAIGPLAGGLLIAAGGSHAGWRLIFLVNLAIGLIAVPAAMRWLPSGTRGQHQQADLPGIALLTACLLAILVPLVEGRGLGWPAWTWASFAVAVPLAAALWRWERHAEASGRTPLIPPRVVRRPSFAIGAVFAALYFASFTSIFFSLAITWQDGFAHSALASGLVVTPFAAGAMLTARSSHTVARRLGRHTLTLGCGLVIAGLGSLLLVVHATTAPSGWYLVTPLLLTGLGHGLIVAPNINLTLAAVPMADNGAASGVLNTAQRLGSAIGIALVGTVLFSTLHPQGTTRQAIGTAFGHSLFDALLVNLALIAATAVLAVIGLGNVAAGRSLGTERGGGRGAAGDVAGNGGDQVR